MGRNRKPGATRRSRFALVCGLAILIVVLAGCDWAAVGFGPEHRNYNPSEPTLTESALGNLETAWSKDCVCTGGELAAGGALYVVNLSMLQSYVGESGALRYSTPIDSDESLVAVANGLVYLMRRPATGSHQLVARVAATGAPRFVKTLPSIGNQPVTIGDVIVDGDLAFVAGITNNTTTVYAIDTSGRVVWARTPGGVGGTLVADPGKTVYVGTSVLLTTGDLSARELPLLTGYARADGAVASSVVVRVERGSAPALAFANGLVYTYSGFAHGGMGVGMSAVDVATGEVKWGRASFPEAVTPGAVISNFEADWAASNPVTGAPLWTRIEPSQPGPTVAVGAFLIRSTGDTLIVHRLSDGSVVDSFVPAAGQQIRNVIVSDGTIFVVTFTGLHAVRPAS